MQNTNTEGCKSERGKQSRGVVLMQDLKMCGGWFERTYSIVTLARESKESKESDGARGGMKRNRIDLLSEIPWTKKTTTNKQTTKATRCTADNAYMQTGLPPSRRAFAPLLVTLCWSNVYLRSFLLFVFAINFKASFSPGVFISPAQSASTLLLLCPAALFLTVQMQKQKQT